MPEHLPILYSFRRCPYAMRARLAIQISAQRCELREIVLRDKAPELVAASPKATVPVLVKPDGEVLEESLDLMNWALGENDPGLWLVPEIASLEEMQQWIDRSDTEFKAHLDHYKYPNRYPNFDPTSERDSACRFLMDLNGRLESQRFLFGSRIALADMAIAPFVRQFANVDRSWFDRQPWKHLLRWLNEFLDSQLFNAIMTKHSKWQAGDPITVFPEA